MHIVFVTTEFVTEKFYCGGLSNFTANMARIFSEHEHQVTVLVAGISKKSFVWDHGIYVECIDRTTKAGAVITDEWQKRIPALTGALKLLGCLAVHRELRRIDSLRPVDVVHYCSLEALGLFPVNKPFAVRLSSYNNLWKGAYRKEFLPDYTQNKRDITDRLEEAAVRRAMAVISPSSLLAEVTEKYLGRKAYVIESPYFFAETEYDTTWYDRELKGKKYILFYGTLGYMKGAHILAELVGRILETYKDIYLVMIGNNKKICGKDGRERAASAVIMENAGKYAERVVYSKSMDKKKLNPVIRNAEMVLLPSRIDNLPNTCIEAMAQKRIVIGTVGASFEQLIRHGYSGFLGKRDKADSYWECIRQVMELSREEKEAIGNNACQRCRKLAPDRVYERYLHFYKSLIRFSDPVKGMH